MTSLRVYRIGVDEAESLAMISGITRHLPPGASLPRIRAVTRHGVITDDGSFGLDRDCDQAWRLVDVGGDCHECTRWRRGVEIARRIVREESPHPLGRPGNGGKRGG